MTTQVLRQGNRIHPEIRFDADQMEIRISGWSFSENPAEIYAPAFELAKAHSSERLKIVVDLKCFNTASTKCLVELIAILRDSNIAATDSTIVTWGYDEQDPESIEWGEDLEMVTGIRFNYEPSEILSRKAS